MPRYDSWFIRSIRAFVPMEEPVGLLRVSAAVLYDRRFLMPVITAVSGDFTKRLAWTALASPRARLTSLL